MRTKSASLRCRVLPWGAGCFPEVQGAFLRCRVLSWGAGCFPEAAIIPCEDGRDYAHDIKGAGHIMLSEDILLLNPPQRPLLLRCFCTLNCSVSHRGLGGSSGRCSQCAQCSRPCCEQWGISIFFVAAEGRPANFILFAVEMNAVTSSVFSPVLKTRLRPYVWTYLLPVFSSL